MTPNSCILCNGEFKRNEKTISCFICESEYHLKCCGIVEESARKIADNTIKYVKFVCRFCEKIKITKQIQEMGIKFDLFKATIDEHNKIIYSIKERIESSTDTDVTHKISYSEILKTNNKVIVVKPRNETQKSQDTQKEIKNKIDPSRLAVGIENIKNINKGGVVIRCSNNDSKEKLKENIRKEIGSEYQVLDPKLKNPKIVISGTEKEIIEENNEVIVNTIIEQNDLHQIDTRMEDKIKIHRKYVNNHKRNYGNIVINVEPEIFTKILQRSTLNIGWRKCNVREHVDIIRCYKCNGYGHFSKECRNKVACGKCASEHNTNECQAETEKCINCLKVDEKLNMKIDYNHTVYDRNCPCYKRIIEKQVSKINYM